MSITKEAFGNTLKGEKVTLYSITNKNGMKADVIDYGAVLVRLFVPAAGADPLDVVLGYDSPERYSGNEGCYFGATIGRSGNRIREGKFILNDKEYKLSCNEGNRSLHSGPVGYDHLFWNAELIEEKNAIRFSRLSPDKEQGFPGNFNISVTYELTEDNELRLTYDGICDADTVANLTNHSYFNLNGEGNGDILSHELVIYASYFTPVDGDMIPTGEYAPVSDTPMDFTQPHTIGERIEAASQQLLLGGGYDHNYIPDDYAPGQVRKVARVSGDLSGIVMEVYTDLPGMQFYAGNFIDDQPGKNGHVYGKRSGLALETQYEPNSINQPEFHSPVLKAGEKYHTVTGYKFL